MPAITPCPIPENSCLALVQTCAVVLHVRAATLSSVQLLLTADASAPARAEHHLMHSCRSYRRARTHCSFLEYAPPVAVHSP
eukprot:6186350-Pleurochrysis_carterae.AAC.1